MCGITAVLLADTKGECGQEIFDALILLQHRGQDAAGIVTVRSDDPAGKFNKCKGLGLAVEVFTQSTMLKLRGNVGIGHCRYPTAGTSSEEEAQPMYINYPCGLALVHNGNLTNTSELQEKMRRQNRHLDTQNDSEALLNLFAEELRVQLESPATAAREADDELHEKAPAIFAAVKQTMELSRGGYAVVILIRDVGIVGFRDPWGIRPMVVGQRPSTTLAGGVDYMFCSETAALDTLGYELIRDVRPGECVIAVPMVPAKPREDKGLMWKQIQGDGKELYPCLFEYIYFARPDSILNGIVVDHARKLMGEKLAAKIMRLRPDHGIDVVIPIPASATPAAIACATALGVKYTEGFVKNRYIGRTFIMPGQAQRRKGVRLKLNTIRSDFKGKTVLLVDDSIVRGTTSKELVIMAREAGSKAVFFASAAPPIRFPNVYGIDLPTAKELIASDRTTEQVCAELGCDWLVYNDLDDCQALIKSLNSEIVHAEASAFDGVYITKDVDAAYFAGLHKERNDAAKQGSSKPRSKPTTPVDAEPALKRACVTRYDK